MNKVIWWTGTNKRTLMGRGTVLMGMILDPYEGRNIEKMLK